MGKQKSDREGACEVRGEDVKFGHRSEFFI